MKKNLLVSVPGQGISILIGVGYYLGNRRVL